MTKFDPEFAREVLLRRQGELNATAQKVMADKWRLIFDNVIPAWGNQTGDYDKRVHQLWDEADSYDSVLSYLDARIWEEKTEGEKVWETMKGWDATFGPELVQDVLLARSIVNGEVEQ